MPKVCESCSLPLPKSQHASTIEYWCSVLEKKIERAAEARRSITDLVIGQERISWRHDLLELEMQTANEIAELYRRRGYECTIDVWENTSNGKGWFEISWLDLEQRKRKAPVLENADAKKVKKNNP